MKTIPSAVVGLIGVLLSGGKVSGARRWMRWRRASGLQQVVWDGKSLPADILMVKISATGFDLHFTRAMEPGVAPDAIAAKLGIQSWFYLDTPKYGSPEHDPRGHMLAGVKISPDPRVLHISLDGFGKQGPWVDRVYHVTLDDAPGLFAEGAPWSKLEAYYTIRAIPSSAK